MVECSGRVFCLECGVSWVRIPSEAANLLWKSDCLGCAVLLCLVVCITLLASFFLPSSSLINKRKQGKVIDPTCKRN